MDLIGVDSEALNRRAAGRDGASCKSCEVEQAGDAESRGVLKETTGVDAFVTEFLLEQKRIVLDAERRDAHVENALGNIRSRKQWPVTRRQGARQDDSLAGIPRMGKQRTEQCWQETSPHVAAVRGFAVE